MCLAGAENTQNTRKLRFMMIQASGANTTLTSNKGYCIIILQLEDNDDRNCGEHLMLTYDLMNTFYWIIESIKLCLTLFPSSKPMVRGRTQHTQHCPLIVQIMSRSCAVKVLQILLYLL